MVYGEKIMAGNKKEIIRELKTRLEICNSERELYRVALAPFKQQATQRGARMQGMMRRLKDIQRTTGITIPDEFYDWFDKDGVPK